MANGIREAAYARQLTLKLHFFSKFTMKTMIQYAINKNPWAIPTNLFGVGMSNTYFRGIVNAKARYDIPSINAKSLRIDKLLEKFIFFGEVTHFS
ncbi:MAG TPA: hypothetical protein VKY37_10900 [Brumimicrobium sp.]|nr:hypothetical protein [Brumimicrobium sp.]